MTYSNIYYIVLADNQLHGVYRNLAAAKRLQRELISFSTAWYPKPVVMSIEELKHHVDNAELARDWLRFRVLGYAQERARAGRWGRLHSYE